MAVPVSQATVDRLTAERAQAQIEHDSYAQEADRRTQMITDLDAILADLTVAP